MAKQTCPPPPNSNAEVKCFGQNITDTCTTGNKESVMNIFTFIALRDHEHEQPSFTKNA